MLMSHYRTYQIRVRDMMVKRGLCALGAVAIEAYISSPTVKSSVPLACQRLSASCSLMPETKAHLTSIKPRAQGGPMITRGKNHIHAVSSHTVFKGNRSSITVRVTVHLVLVVDLFLYGNTGTSRCCTPPSPPSLSRTEGRWLPALFVGILRSMVTDANGMRYHECLPSPPPPKQRFPSPPPTHPLHYCSRLL